MSIYIIRSKDLSLHDCYIGSTKDLKSRMKHHKTRCFNKNSRAYNYKLYQFVRANGGWDNFDMVEICKCENDKLRETEQYHIDFIKPSLNIQRAYRSEECDKEDRKELCKEYYEKNKNTILQKVKEYRENNRDYYREYFRKRDKVKRAERRKVKITCECGSICTTDNKARHNRSKKHQNYIQSLSSS